MLVTAQNGRRATRVEGVGERGDDLEVQAGVFRAVADEPGNGLRHNAPFLGQRTPFHEHAQIELLRRQPLQSVPTDRAELPLVHVLEQAVFQVGIAEPASVVVAEDALDMGGGQNFADHVEHSVVIEGVPDFLELLQQPLQHAAFDGVRGDEVEDQAVLALAVPVDAPHALFESVGVPGDVIVEKDVANLEVDAFTCGLGGHQDLDRPIAELLLGIEPRSRLVAGTGPHAAVDEADPESPLLEFAHEIVQRVLELREDQQSLILVIEETLFLKQFLEPG